MPGKTKLSTLLGNTGRILAGSPTSAPCGTFNSSTMIVIMIPITPSLNAVNRSLFTDRLSRARLDHQHGRPRGRDAAPDVRFVLLEAPGLVSRADHHELAAIEPPGDRGKARDGGIAARLQHHHEAVRVVGGVAEREFADRPT